MATNEFAIKRLKQMLENATNIFHGFSKGAEKNKPQIILMSPNEPVKPSASDRARALQYKQHCEMRDICASDMDVLGAAIKALEPQPQPVPA